MSIGLSLNGTYETRINKAFLSAQKKKLYNNKNDLILKCIDIGLNELIKNKVI